MDQAPRVVPVDEEGLARAARILRNGGLVAFPTETVYGLGARADSSEAVRAIYRAKGRPAENPSIVHVATAARAFDLAAHVPDVARALAAEFWPGPLTLVLPLREGAVAPEVTAGGATVAVRVPVHPAARALLERAALPIAAPSANRSNGVSPTTAAHVVASLGDRVEIVLDGGPTGFGIESAIVDVASTPPRLLRRGSLSLEVLRSIAPALVDRASAITVRGERAASPGTFARHYAPSCRVVVAPLDVIATRAARAIASNARVGALTLSTSTPLAGVSIADALPAEPEAYARGLYAALHRLDAAGLDLLVVEAPPRAPEWAAIHDRLARASAPPGG